MGSPISIATSINPLEYVLVTNNSEPTSIFISIDQVFNGEGDFFELNKKAFENGLRGMDARKFLPHLLGAIEASNRKGALYDLEGNLVEGRRLNEYANTLSHDCNVYFNGHLRLSSERIDSDGFIDGGLWPVNIIAQPEGFRKFDLARITSYLNGKPVSTREPLLPCLERDCWADITPESLNAQGLPTKKSPIGDKYEPGKTAYFIPPTQAGDVLGFFAGKEEAVFSCFRDGRDSSPDLGIFTCYQSPFKQELTQISVAEAGIYQNGVLVREIPVQIKKE